MHMELLLQCQFVFQLPKHVISVNLNLYFTQHKGVFTILEFGRHAVAVNDLVPALGRCFHAKQAQ